MKSSTEMVRRNIFSLLLLALVVFTMVGCAIDDDRRNASLRPWNTPKSWENGLPAGLTEGR